MELQKCEPEYLFPQLSVSEESLTMCSCGLPGIYYVDLSCFSIFFFKIYLFRAGEMAQQ